MYTSTNVYEQRKEEKTGFSIKWSYFYVGHIGYIGLIKESVKTSSVHIHFANKTALGIEID